MPNGLGAEMGFLERVIAALWLDLAFYRQVSMDAAASGQAFRVVLLSGVSNGFVLVYRLGSLGIVAGIVTAILGWFLWTAVILLVAGGFGHRRDGRSLLRTLGFANAPGWLLFTGMVPVVGAALRVGVVLWLLAATVVAVEAVFDVHRRRALLISILGFVAYLLLGIVSGHFAAS